MTTYTITIDQSAITASKFPRSVDWWRHYLPVWLTHREHWTQNYADLVNTNVTVDELGGLVRIHAEDRRRADQIMRFFSNHVLRKFLPEPEEAIKLMASATPASNARA